MQLSFSNHSATFKFIFIKNMGQELNKCLIWTLDINDITTFFNKNFILIHKQQNKKI